MSSTLYRGVMAAPTARAVALVLSASVPLHAEPLTVGDGQDWMFVNSKWKDTDADGIAGARTGDGDGLQGYCLAFYTAKAYRDLEARFTVQMKTNHADIGLIVRAQSPTRYYLIHFPQGGQSYRAQHFWAALSVADGTQVVVNVQGGTAIPSGGLEMNLGMSARDRAFLKQELMESQSFVVVEREKILDIVREQNFGKTSYVNPATVVEPGELMGVQYLIEASVGLNMDLTALSQGNLAYE